LTNILADLPHSTRHSVTSGKLGEDDPTKDTAMNVHLSTDSRKEGSMNRSRYTFFAALLVVMLTVAGWGPLNFGINTRAVTITVNLDEGTLNTLLTQVQESVIAVNGEALLGKIDRIDFIEPDTIRVFGTRTQNGNTVEGSFDVNTVLDQGALKASITALNIPGLNMDSPIIQQINNELSAAFSEQISQQQEGTISSVQVTEDALNIVIEVPFR